MSLPIQITKCDNELVLVAFKTDYSEAYILCDIKSGNNYDVNVTINVESSAYAGPVVKNGVLGPISGSFPVTIPSGDYKLVIAGINWGGPSAFAFSFQGTPYSLPASSSDVGVVWHPIDDISFTV